jgi:squalene-hopene/tetraprenyl-beta-curcumene cyclase
MQLDMTNNPTSLDQALTAACDRLLAARTPDGHWAGKLSSSALSTATTVFALHLVDRAGGTARFTPLIRNGLQWLAANANEDGGWGDTILSRSNISTTLLVWSALTASPDGVRAYQPVATRAERWLRRRYGTLHPAALAENVHHRYGDDRTFSAPILTMCALAGRLGPAAQAWRHVAPLPFELAACPHRWLKWLRVPVVSYALPALVAIGQVRFHFRAPYNPAMWGLRAALRAKTLRVLTAIQPPSGGFLEAAPLTSFVAMSLAAMDLADHPVTQKAAGFLAATVLPDGSWPIDTNLATWATTLSVASLGDDLPPADRPAIRRWLLDQQHRVEHPYTHAPPGGWAWTDLSGGVPDADDTAGALVALRHLGLNDDGLSDRVPLAACPPVRRPENTGGQAASGTPVGTIPGFARRVPAPAAPNGATVRGGYGDPPRSNVYDDEVRSAAAAGVKWLLDIQNTDGGIPTFCRGWGRLPFDRSSPDLTAHAVAAWAAWVEDLPPALQRRTRTAIGRALTYLEESQGHSGAWVPLWFGNQDSPFEQNPTYGTARVVSALEPLARAGNPVAARLVAKGAAWLVMTQSWTGGWGGAPAAPASTEETALALDALARVAVGGYESPPREVLRPVLDHGTDWLLRHTDFGRRLDPAPIGLYFAKLWYYEELYPVLFTVSALRQLREVAASG